MVSMNSEAPSLPRSLEPVRLPWVGMHGAEGRVARVYPHVIDRRPMVVVDLSPDDEEGDYYAADAALVEPDPGADTPWARTYRYQRDVVAAFARGGVEATPCPNFEGWPHLRIDGGRVAVELQPAVPRRYPFARARKALKADPSLAGVLIVARDDREPPRDRRLRIVRWKDRRDDRRLARALAELTG